jgi:hypothetical protein
MLSCLRNLLIAVVAFSAGVSNAAPTLADEGASVIAARGLAKRATLTCSSSASQLKFITDAYAFPASHLALSNRMYTLATRRPRPWRQSHRRSSPTVGRPIPCTFLTSATRRSRRFKLSLTRSPPRTRPTSNSSAARTPTPAACVGLARVPLPTRASTGSAAQRTITARSSECQRSCTPPVVSDRGAPEISFCPQWFNNANLAQFCAGSSPPRASTVVHELTHAMSHTHDCVSIIVDNPLCVLITSLYDCLDSSGGCANARSLAASDPAKAALNAESYGVRTALLKAKYNTRI